MSLKTKFLAGVSAFMLLIVGLVTLNILLDLSLRQRREAEALAQVMTDWTASRVELRAARSDSPWLRVEASLRGSRILAGWKIVGYPGHPIGGPVPEGLEPTVFLSGPVVEPVVSAEERRIFNEVLASGRARTIGSRSYVPFRSDGGEVFAARWDLAPEAAMSAGAERTLTEVAWLMVAATALILIVVYVFLNRFVLRPLGSLVDASRRVAQGDYSRTAPMPSSYDEIHTLVEAFNLMMVCLQEHHRKMQEDVKMAREKMSQTERKLLVAQRLSAAGTLAAGVAHEINNPLGGMLNAAMALRDGGLEAEKRREYLTLIVDGLDRIRNIVGQILRMSPRPYKKATVDAREPVTGAVALVRHKARQKGVDVDARLDPEPQWVQADPGELQQAVLNVVINAVDASPAAGGRVAVEVGPVPEGVRIAVRDNGIGMDEGQLARCLEPFFTTKDVGEGTGLGLSVAHGIVMQHGGDMYIETRKGDGTTITFVLPAAGREPATAPPPAAEAPFRTEEKR